MGDPLKWLALLVAWCGGEAPPEGDTGPAPGEEPAACDEREDAIFALTDEANYCEVDADCADAGAACPFGCTIGVNEAELDRVQAELAAWREDCLYCDYSCLPYEGMRCEDGECVAHYAKIP